jgi:hypothetical protein
MQGCDILKYMRYHSAKHGNMEYELFEWFRCARKNRLAVVGQTVKGKANEIALKFGGPGPGSEHVVGEKEKVEKSQLLAAQPLCQYALHGIVGAGFSSKCE